MVAGKYVEHDRSYSLVAAVEVRPITSAGPASRDACCEDTVSDLRQSRVFVSDKAPEFRSRCLEHDEVLYPRLDAPAIPCGFNSGDSLFVTAADKSMRVRLSILQNS